MAIYKYVARDINAKKITGKRRLGMSMNLVSFYVLKICI